VNSSFEYIQGKRRFESAITAARGAGRSDEEIARATGLTLEMIEAVAGKQRD
jgi:hypothetical protein